MFQKLLATHSDVTDVVLHYALAYLDDDEKRHAGFWSVMPHGWIRKVRHMRRFRS